MTIKVSRVGLNSDPVVAFPAKPLLYVDDKISLAASDLEDNSQGSLGEAVFFSYRGLHEILSGAKTHLSFEDNTESTETEAAGGAGQWSLNSRIISASLGRGRHIELQRPVNILLRHLERAERARLQMEASVRGVREVNAQQARRLRTLQQELSTLESQPGSTRVPVKRFQ